MLRRMVRGVSTRDYDQLSTWLVMVLVWRNQRNLKAHVSEKHRPELVRALVGGVP